MMFNFEWDENKAKINLQKHRVSFEEATGAFYDSLALYIEDKIHSIGEERYFLIGNTKNKLFVISFTERNNSIRIISARHATKKEKKTYEERN